MRFRTLEIRLARLQAHLVLRLPARVLQKGASTRRWQLMHGGSQSYRLATAGEDNHVRVWMVYPNIRASTTASSVGDEKEKPRPARVEYLATLSRHSAAVNVVRRTDCLGGRRRHGYHLGAHPRPRRRPHYGSDLSPADLQHEKEYWKPRTTFRCTTMQVYDLAWSKALLELAEHTHFVQGVAWDPLNEYIATQSSDRAMHVYKLGAGKSTFEAHAIGRNTRFPAPSHRAHSRTPSIHRDDSRVAQRPEPPTPPPPPPHPTHNPDVHPRTGYQRNDDGPRGGMGNALEHPRHHDGQVGAPAGYSAVSGFSRYGRSPSPMPALPAIRTLPPAGWGGYEERTRSRERSGSRYNANDPGRSGSRYGASYDERRHPDAGTRLYGDESFSNFFRRLAFSPDGALLLTPAGTFEDPSASVVGWEGLVDC
ncbi:hypothetical protein C8R46DRAFT_1326040 [Mycena filopes]|nr:hypothetical protein C8R46DRAFT_1326040 [Mycena filopes]